MEYRNQGSIAMLLVPLHQVIGARTDEPIGVPASGKLHGVPILQVPVDQPIPPREAVRVPWQEMSWQVYSPGNPKESRLGQKLSPRFAQELGESREESGIQWWTGTIKTNIFDFDVPLSPTTESGVRSFKID